MTIKVVAGFAPSVSGLHFRNAFPHVPDIKIDVLGSQIGIGDAANGLCGGMGFTVRDYFESGVTVPTDTIAPSSGPLFDYMVRRLFDSFNLFGGPVISGPIMYMSLMNPHVPDHETVMSNLGLAPRGRAWSMIEIAWPDIKKDLDNGRLSPIGLISVKSEDPLKMGQNHQVLAYGYSLDGDDLVIRLYDPNYENDDTVTMSLNIKNPQHTTPVTYSKSGRTVLCFFRPHYTFSSPSQYDWRWCHKCYGLFFSAGQASVGHCPAGGQHEKGASGNYDLTHGEAPSFNGQNDWRWCHKCYGLFFSAGQASVGHCPAGGQHEKDTSGNYTLSHEAPNFKGQNDWRWCHKCYGLFFSAGQASVGHCPAGGPHEKGVSGNYTVEHSPN